MAGLNDLEQQAAEMRANISALSSQYLLEQQQALEQLNVYLQSDDKRRMLVMLGLVALVRQVTEMLGHQEIYCQEVSQSYQFS